MNLRKIKGLRMSSKRCAFILYIIRKMDIVPVTLVKSRVVGLL